VIASIAPPPACSICGAANCARRNREKHVQLVGSTEICHRHVEGLRAAATGVADEQGELAEVVHAVLDQLRKLGLVGDVAGAGGGLTTGSDDLVTHPFGSC
jgi:DNA-binding IscR family transcriptional regulator